MVIGSGIDRLNTSETQQKGVPGRGHRKLSSFQYYVRSYGWRDLFTRLSVDKGSEVRFQKILIRVMNDASDMIYNKCLKGINNEFHDKLRRSEFSNLVSNTLYVTISLMMGNLKIH